MRKNKNIILLLITLMCIISVMSGCSNKTQNKDASKEMIDTANNDKETSSITDDTNISNTTTSQDDSKQIENNEVSQSDVSNQSNENTNIQSQTPQNNTTQQSQHNKTVHTHEYTLNIVAPTCTTQGYTVHTCSCSHSYTDSYTNATGHNMTGWYVIANPTITAEGANERKCTNCGYTETSSIPKLQQPSNTSAYASEVIRLVNAQRSQNGLSQLQARNDLNSFATTRSQELVQIFDHVRPDGTNPLNTVINYGYMSAGENIAMGYNSPQDVVNGWLNSPGHRANILNSSFSYIGVGYYSHNGTLYWTQIFAG